MKKILTEERLLELAGLRQEAPRTDTQVLEPGWRAARGQDKTVALSPVEFQRELAKEIDLENWSEEKIEQAWRRWSAEKRKAEEANKPPPPPASVVAPTAKGPSPDQTLSLDAVEDPTGSEFREKWKGKKYTESERLFRHFFGKYDDDKLELLMNNKGSLEEIIRSLYGWQHPRWREDGIQTPATDTIKIAQQFEKERKSIDGNEEEFMDRLQKYQLRTGKAEFEPERLPTARYLAKKKALTDIIEKHKNDPRFAEELPPLAHAGAYGMKLDEYAAYLQQIFKDEYEDLYKKHLGALLSP